MTTIMAVAGLMLLAGPCAAKTFFLDERLSSSCPANYSIARRDCSGTDGLAVANLQDAMASLQGGDTLMVRSGIYVRATRDLFAASLQISKGGTTAQPTVVRAYPSEQPVLCTEAGRCRYNPHPADSSVNVCTGAGGEGGAACYYPNPAVGISANFVRFGPGIKTFEQVLVRCAAAAPCHDVVVEGNDLGGGGPHLNQGQVVMLHDAYNTVVRNNRIHHSAWGESAINGAAIMGYNFSATIENNEFYDNFGSDIRLKDAGGQQGRTTIIRYNFFRPSAINPANAGVQGIGQDGGIDRVLIHNNIFFRKASAIIWDGPALIETVAYNNTFVDCAQDVNNWRPGGSTNLFNNLHYHSLDTHYFYFLESPNFPLSDIRSDFNVFHSSADDTRFKHGSAIQTTLSGWRSYAGKDAASAAKDPGFMNASGTRPEDFKRLSYAGEVAGSPYGAMAGAYETGLEVIGLLGTSLPPTADAAPDRPRNLR